MRKNSVRNMTRAAVFAALTAVCSWVSLPMGDIALTMQTFAVYLTLFLLGGKWGFATMGIYLALGSVGLPVFSAFQGGLGVLLGPSGGFLWGFLLFALVYWIFEGVNKVAAMVLGLFCCYGCGCLWFSYWSGGGFCFALVRSVLPFLLPDLIKLYLAYGLSRRLASHF